MSNNDLILFNGFAKGKRVIKHTGSNCVIYTRVSTKEQADNNMSLETQKKACEQYAVKNGYQIMGYFGGTYESAKTDERTQFNNMLAFVKKSKEKISHIIVYSVDRFSRSGANAIYIAEKLKREGIIVYAVSQPTDTTTASGSLQQNIQFIFSEYDNQLRREKCMAGMKEKLLAGGWIGRVPLGYDIVIKDGKKQIVLNDKGKLIRKAFTWKLQDISNEDIRLKLKAHGWDVADQRVSDFFKNPFYCGLISHNALEGSVVEGKHEKAVSKDIFLQVNGLLARNNHGYSMKPENNEVPLKRFIHCENCGKPLTGYKSSKIQQYYYKCITKGCKCNRRAIDMHDAFTEILADYCIDMNDELKELITEQLVVTFNQLNADKIEAKENAEKQILEVRKKISRLEERYILEDIDKEMFTRYKEKFADECAELEKQMAVSTNKLSNLEKYINKAIEYASNLAPMWALADYGEKQRLQFLVFPEGISYNREKDSFRTLRVNSVFSCIASLAQVSGQNKNGKINRVINFPAWVEAHGFEPRTLCL